MDDWTYPYPDPEVGAPYAHPMLLGQVWNAAEEVLRASQADPRAQVEADCRAVDLERARIWDSVDDDGRNILDVPLPFEAPDHTSLTH